MPLPTLPPIPKQKLFLIVGVILAIIAIFMIKLYLDQQKQIAMQQAKGVLDQIRSNQITVLVAKADIPPGKVLDPDMLEARVILNRDKEDRAVDSLARIEGMMAAQPIARGEQITLNKLMYVKGASGLAESTPPGKRAVTISVDNISSLAGLIKPGDYVDVIATIPVPAMSADGKQTTQPAMVPLFQNVLILAVGQDLGTPKSSSVVSRYIKEDKKEQSSLVTLALNPQEANIIAFVQEQGKIRLVLRSPVDSRPEPIRPVSWDSVFQYLFPQPPVEPAPPEPPKPTVEIYRGSQKETVILAE